MHLELVQQQSNGASTDATYSLYQPGPDACSALQVRWRHHQQRTWHPAVSGSGRRGVGRCSRAQAVPSSRCIAASGLQMAFRAVRQSVQGVPPGNVAHAPLTPGSITCLPRPKPTHHGITRPTWLWLRTELDAVPRRCRSPRWCGRRGRSRTRTHAWRARERSRCAAAMCNVTGSLSRLK